MENTSIISGQTEEEIWEKVEAELEQNEFEYSAILEQGDKKVELNIDIDPGGGFEGGWSITQFKAELPVSIAFRFALHDTSFIDSIGRFIGIDHLKIGYPAFDDHIVIKTNDEPKLHDVFADEQVQAAFNDLDDFDFGIHTHHAENSDNEIPYLELNINSDIEDNAQLRQIYHAFYTVLSSIV